MDVSGKKVQILAKNSNGNMVDFDASNLNAGIYFLNLKSENNSITKKIVIE